MSEEKNRIFEKIHSNPQLQILLKKIRSGKADFKDTSQYADLFSKIMGSEFSEIIPQIPHGMREQLCVELLRGSYENINKILAQVQNSIDKEKGIRLAPQKAEFPEERVKKIAVSLEDETVPEETIQRRADSGTANVSRSFHDDYIKKNAEFRSNAGLKCYLERETDGKCCPWCSALAGRYLVGEQPPDIFRRHDNCGCTVVLIDGKTRQYAWSKKTWSREEEREYLKNLGKNKKTKRLSRDQAKALQDKNLPKSLTRGADSDIIELENNRRILREKIRNKEITTILNPEKQNPHIFGSPEYDSKNNKSYFTVSIEELQEIISSKCGTGEITIFKNGQIKETIQVDENIGVVIGVNGENLGNTNMITIHYSNKRTHIVPKKNKE